MSGGSPSGPAPAEGDHPACTNEERKAGDTAGDAQSAATGLALTARGPQAPLQTRSRSQPQAGRSAMREGSLPNGGDAGSGSGNAAAAA